MYLKLFLVIGLILMVVPAKAQPVDEAEVLRLIDSGLEPNKSVIQAKAAKLEATARERIYTQKQKNPALPFLLNLFIGLGIGSIAAGDSEGFIWEGGGEIASSAIFAGLAITAWSISAPRIVYINGERQSEPGQEIAPALAVGLVLSAATAMGFRIYGLVRPFQYTDNYNRQLREALGIGTPPLSLRPGLGENLNPAQPGLYLHLHWTL